MNIIKWKEIFSCQIDSIDSQHKKLFEIASQIFELAQLDDSFDHYDEIMTVLQELKDYTNYHFDYEESLMRKYQYPDFERHKIEHDFIRKKVEYTERKDIDSDQRETILELVTFLVDWISNHILKTDMSYKEFFLEKGVE